MDKALKNVLHQQKRDSDEKESEVDKRLAKKSKAFIEMWKDRFSLIAEAHKQKSSAHPANALRYMQKYLDLVAQYFEVPEEELKPSLFTEGDKDIAEIMLISLVYLDLAKAYSLSDQEKHHTTAVRYLDQFVTFTSGFKFQYLNAKNLRKYIRRKEARRQDVTIFKNAYRKIALDSAACYIATFCYPPGHEVLKVLRYWKQHLVSSRPGFWLVDYYYRFSPLLVQWAAQRPGRAKVLRNLLRPGLTLFSKILGRFFPAAVRPQGREPGSPKYVAPPPPARPSP